MINTVLRLEHVLNMVAAVYQDRNVWLVALDYKFFQQ